MAYTPSPNKNEDTAHTTGDAGIMPLAVRNDTRGALAGTDLDYAPLQLNASGDLRIDGSAVTQPVSAASLPLPSGAATSAKQDTGNTSLSSIDGKITAVNTGAVVISSGSVTADTELPAAAALADNSANPTAPAVGAHNLVWDATNSDWELARKVATNVTSTGVPAAGIMGMFDDTSPTATTENQFSAIRMSANRNLYTTLRDAAGNERGVNVTASNALTVDASATTQPVSMATNQPVGNVAHDAADSGSPVKVGFKAETSPKGITAVADGDRTDAYADADGLQMVKLNTSFGDLVSERVTDTGGTSTAFTNFSAVASTRNYVTAITVYNSSATAGTVDFRDGTAGSVLWTMPIPAGGGSVLANAMPLFKTTANTALAYDVSGALSTVTISVSGFQSKV